LAITQSNRVDQYKTSSRHRRLCPHQRSAIMSKEIGVSLNRLDKTRRPRIISDQESFIRVLTHAYKDLSASDLLVKQLSEKEILMFYRPEIDGLRSLAVLPVIFYHAGFSMVSGGFVGVDIFFVISGYLITFLLLRELEQAQTISISKFYERRIRRIIPALIAVSIASSIAAFNWLPPQALDRFGAALTSTFLFVSNIYFWRNTGYFDSAAELNPLLHTWSLSVEEQFYIFFPLLLLFLFRFRKSQLVPILVLFAAASLTLAQYLVRNHQGAAFYLITSRAWELLAGSLCAIYLTYHAQLLPKNPVIREGLSIAGMLLLLASIFFLDHKVPFPGLAAAPVVIGTVFIICFSQHTITGKVLSAKPLVAIGLISYSLYLWHQPIFAFARLRCQCEPDFTSYLLLIVLSFALAYLCWKFIESPFRHKKRLSPTKLYWYCGSAAALLLAFAISAKFSHGMKFRFSEEVLAAIEIERDSDKTICPHKSILADAPGVELCEFGASDSREVVALIGDSHAGMLLHPLNQKLTQGQKKGVFIINWNCHVIPGFIGNAGHESKLSDCESSQKVVLNYLKNNKASTILIARWSFSIAPIEGYLDNVFFDNKRGGIEKANAPRENYVLVNGARSNNPEAAATIIENYIESLAHASKILALVKPVPEVGWDVPTYNFMHYLEHGSIPNEIQTDYHVYLERNRFILEIMERIHEDNIVLVSPSDFLCDASLNVCLAQSNRHPLYYDDDHLNREGASILVDNMLSSLDKQPAGYPQEVTIDHISERSH
jgi:peptidoglycan/LPS O-acetylase OafA/YrhL